MRFHFHTKDGRCYPDEDGIDLPGLDAARVQAVRVLGDLLTHAPSLFLEDCSLQVIVTDSDQLTLFCIEVSYIAAPALSQGTR
jgi:hypothetical protein